MTSETRLQMDGRKDLGYYSNERSDLVGLLPQPVGRVLDVGCGTGAVGRELREKGAARIVGIEPNARAAALARQTYDEVIEATVEQALVDLEGRFDTLLCFDVLEHLVDPWAVLRQLTTLVSPAGRLEISVPNARHLSLAWDLFVRGTFGYADWGHRDNTHLRWFTRRDIVAAVEQAGWRIDLVSYARLSLARRLLERLSFGRSSEFMVFQWYVLATPAL